MTTNTLRTISTTLTTLAALLALTPLAPSVALAGDDDLICFEYQLENGEDELECDTRGNYKAECALTDPDTTTDFCQNIHSEFEGRDEMPQSLSDTGGGSPDPVPTFRPLGKLSR
ncbi:hypothetical protein [uncultured Devosia sp.]|uniref:hypothetical protein n=1 Tax=uncultured Devosia sp. TaxID=211434 RepID=UPI0026268889|nr:hypothetical protein [uncultured Devosia sp.]